jgi:copper chaperone
MLQLKVLYLYRIKQLECMKTFLFKTNINCSSCIATISPELNFKDKIKDWSVDVTIPEKILTITTEYSEKAVQEILEKVGYKAELLKA